MQLFNVQNTSCCFSSLAPGVSKKNRATRKKTSLLESRASRMTTSGKIFCGEDHSKSDANIKKTQAKLKLETITVQVGTPVGREVEALKIAERRMVDIRQLLCKR